ncbi:MAG: DEAD/DEAH box helicase [Verrucomicrobiota bacterium]
MSKKESPGKSPRKQAEKSKPPDEDNASSGTPGEGRSTGGQHRGRRGGSRNRGGRRSGDATDATARPPAEAEAGPPPRSSTKPNPALQTDEKGPEEGASEGSRNRSRSRSRGRGSSRRPREDGAREDRPSKGDRPAEREAPREGIEPVPELPWDPASYVVEAVEGKTRFQDLGLPDEILHAIADLDFEYCTPIQADIMPRILTGIDGLGKAQTGTGKTAAFLITAFTKLLRDPPEQPLRNGAPRVLVIAPTRELVIQIEEEAAVIGKYTGLRTMAVYGGLDYQKQKSILQNEQVDLVAATPGRLLDFRRSHVIHLGHVEVLVIDEADRMLDMGFIPDVRQIVRSTPFKTERQTLFFSATFNEDVDRLSEQWTTDPVRVEIEPETVAADTVDQRIYLATDREKLMVVYNIIKQEKSERVLIFANRRNQVRDLCETLDRYGISCALLSGDVPQAKRVKTLERFKSGEVPVLVATDVAGRGLHVEGVSHVINYSLPDDPEDYVHRIGRTGRAGVEGKSISFASQQDAFVLPDIEKFLGHELRCEYPEEELLTALPKAPPRAPRSSGSSRGRGGGDRPRTGGGGGRSRSGGGRSGGGRPRGGTSRGR